ncbi:MAG: ribosomal protein S18-alanine N-acetyltransferase [Oscillospiraceae bacterium]|nr:ribosomal protein S18-alanine N-acetyltransferase [Oscillospiraceae bacterium]
MKNFLTVDIIYELEQKCFSEPWSKAVISLQLNNTHASTVIKTVNAVPAGYATGLRMGEESELYRIAVLPEYRRQGFAKELLLRFIEKCGGDVFLETRSRNAAAIRLYESAGFKQIGLRKNYYGDDDAVVYRYKA